MKEILKGLLFSCLPMIVGALILAGALYYWRLGREFRDQGVTTQATVVEKRRDRSANVFLMKFSDLNEKPWTVEIRAPAPRSSGIEKGSTWPVTYIPARPEKAEMGRKWGAYIQGWLALLVAAFGGGMLVYGLYLVFNLLTGRLKPGDI